MTVVATESDYQRYLERRSDAGNWFTFYRDYLEVMSHKTALFVQGVLNLSNLQPTNSTDKRMRKQGWIRCGADYVEKTLKFSTREQQLIIWELEGYKRKDFNRKKKSECKRRLSRAFIEVTRAGMPARRYIKVNILQIEKAIDKTREDNDDSDPLQPPVATHMGKQGKLAATRPVATHMGKHVATPVLRHSINKTYKEDDPSGRVARAAGRHPETSNESKTDDLPSVDDTPTVSSRQSTQSTNDSSLPQKILHYAQSKSHKDIHKQSNHQPNRPPSSTTLIESTKEKSSSKIEKIYYELDDLLYRSTCAKLDRKLTRGNIFRRARALRSIHRRMDHPDDLKSIIKYYSSHDIVSKKGKALIIYGPTSLDKPGIMCWLLESMADDGYRNIHLNKDRAKRHGLPTSGIGARADEDEILYKDEEKGITVQRKGLGVWVDYGKEIKTYRVDIPTLARIIYEDKSKDVEISHKGGLVTIKIGEESSQRDLSY